MTIKIGNRAIVTIRDKHRWLWMYLPDYENYLNGGTTQYFLITGSPLGWHGRWRGKPFGDDRWVEWDPDFQSWLYYPRRDDGVSHGWIEITKSVADRLRFNWERLEQSKPSP